MPELGRASSRGNAVDAAVGEDQREPDAGHHGRYPEPERDHEDDAERRPPAGDRPEQDQQALVEGISPPASPSTKRLRQATVVPVAGRWLWGMPL